jgi:hypothetical protein
LDDIFEGPAFQCHKTVDYSGGHDEGLPGDRPQQCAGLMAVLIREGQPNQIMQLAFRLRKLVADEVDPDGEAYRSIADAISAHGGKEPA